MSRALSKAKAKAVAEGAVIGGAETAAVVAAISAGRRGLGAVAPRAAGVAARVGGGLMSAPVLAGAAGLGGLYGGVQSYRHGDSLGQIALSTLGGAASLGTNMIADAMTGHAHAETMDEAQSRLGTKFGGSPNDIKLAAENSRRAMAESKSQKSRDANERRALALEREYERVTGQHIGPTAPNQVTPPTPVAPVHPEKAVSGPADEGIGHRMLRKAGEAVENAVFGAKAPKPENALDKQRRELESQIAFEREKASKEYAAHPGEGPNQKVHRDEITRLQGELAKITDRQAAKEAEELAAYRQVGALAAGAAIGGWLGAKTTAKAHAAAEAAGVGITKLAKTAIQAVNSVPKGVIRGTVAGDKAGAAVRVAESAAAKPVVSAVEAFGVPALNIAHGVGMYAMGSIDKDNPAAPLMRMEGAGAIAAGVIGGKYGMAAYAMRAKMAPDVAGKLAAAENRLAREAKTGPAAVAQQRAKRLTSIATGKADVAAAKARTGTGVAQAQGAAKVEVAGVRGRGDVKVAQIRGKGRVASTQIAAEMPVIKAGAQLGVAKAAGAGAVDASKFTAKQSVVNAGTRMSVAKVKGAAAVEQATVRGKLQTAQDIQAGQHAGGPPNPLGYKDVWQDSRGRIYHRKNMAVRTNPARKIDGGLAADNDLGAPSAATAIRAKKKD